MEELPRAPGVVVVPLEDVPPPPESPLHLASDELVGLRRDLSLAPSPDRRRAATKDRVHLDPR